MDLELYPKTNAPCIEGYGNGYINISGTRFSNTVLLLSNKYIDIGTSLENDIKLLTNQNKILIDSFHKEINKDKLNKIIELLKNNNIKRYNYINKIDIIK